MTKYMIRKNIKQDRNTTRGTRWTLETENTTYVAYGTKKDAVNHLYEFLGNSKKNFS